MPPPPVISAGEREYIVRGFEADVRNDGRQRLDYRRVEMEVGKLVQTSGSASLKLGKTEVIVAVKVEIGVPDEDRPDWGRLQVAVECSPVANPAFMGRGGDELAAELAQALDRSLPRGGKGGGVLDMGSLSILSGKTCWVLYVDALVLNLDGGALDALSLATKAALADVKIPKVEIVMGEDPDDEPDYGVDTDPASCRRLDTSGLPVTVTVSQVGTACGVDLTATEGLCASAAVQVSVDPSGRVTGLVKRGQRGLDPGIMLEMVETARRLAPKMHATIDSFLAAHLQDGFGTLFAKP